MNLDYLEPLVNGTVPPSSKYDALSLERKQVILDFVSNIPTRFPLDEIKQDLPILFREKESLSYFIVNKWESIGANITMVVFFAYWILFGFWWSLFCSIGVIVIVAWLESHFIETFGLSKSTIDLLNRFSKLLDRQVSLQKKQNQSKS